MKTPARPSPALQRETHDVADRLHSIAIHLLRRLRRVDIESRLTGPRLSALSVVVFGGPITLSALAQAEQVSPPTMTRLVQALEREGYLTRIPDPIDRRVTRVAATRRGLQVMREGRERRVRMLAALLLELPAAELKAVRAAVLSLESVIAGRRTIAGN
jgi:DNA-binding MarR family transcriptional regulator